MQSILITLGATSKEALSWQKMFKLGAQPVSVIARHMGVPRSSMYVILERLKRLDLTEKFNRGGITYVQCISPEKLEDVLNAQKREIQQSISSLRNKLPELTAQTNKLAITPAVTFHEGKASVMRMYETVLREQSFCSFFNPQAVGPKMPEYYEYVAQHARKNNKSVKEILVAGKDALQYQKKFSSALHEIKILKKKHVFDADIIIGKSTLYFMSYDEKDISGTEVHSQTLAHAHHTIFNALWESI